MGIIIRGAGAKHGIVLAVVLALVLPAFAYAQGSSTCQAYNPQLCAVAGQTKAKPDGAAASASAGALPFTGLDLGLLAVGGCFLLGGGLIVRRLSLPRE